MNRGSKILSYLIPLFPLMRPYSIGGKNIDTLLLLIICLIFAILFRWRLKPNSIVLKPFAFFTLYSIIIPPLIAAPFYGKFSIVFLPLVAYCFLSLVNDNANLTDVYKIYKIIVYICCFFFFFQEVSDHFFSVKVSGMIPFLDNAYTKSQDMTTEAFIERQSMISRNSSFFLEPAHFAQYISPCLFIMLLRKEYFSFFGIIVVTSSMLLSRSGNGLILLCLAYLFLIISSSKSLVAKLLILSMLFIGSFAYLSTDGSELLERKDEISVSNMEAKSGFVRIFRGYFLWDELPPTLKVVGIGKNTNDMFEHSSLSWTFYNENDRFLNGIQSVLVESGIIGVILLGFFFLYVYRKGKLDNLQKGILVALITLMFVESIFLSSYMLLYLSFVLGIKNSRLKL